jgi:hypothetical protein
VVLLGLSWYDTRDLPNGRAQMEDHRLYFNNRGDNLRQGDEVVEGKDPLAYLSDRERRGLGFPRLSSHSSYAAWAACQ